MMDEKTALNGTTTSKDQEWKQKKGYTPLIVLTALLLGCGFYAGQIHGARTSLAVGSGTTHGGATTFLMMESDDDDAYSKCVKSEGTYDSQKDYCYTCGGVQHDDDGSTDFGKIGYCWNSQHPQCLPACGNVQGVSGIGDNQCGEPCDGFDKGGGCGPSNCA